MAPVEDDEVRRLKQEFMFKYKGKRIMTRYPQMGVKESRIWTNFLKWVPWGDIEEIWYAVRVGKPYIPASILEDPVRRLAVAVTTLRIDAVVWRPMEVWLFEVKEIANVVAVGQVITYRQYFAHEYQPKRPIKCGIVAEDYKVGILDVLRAQGISLFVCRDWGCEVVVYE